MKSNPKLESMLQEYVARGLIVPRTENNATLKCTYKGAGTLITEKWNVKIYNSGSIVCTDFQILNAIEKDELKAPDASLKVIQIDDAGWGFPLLGVMVGVTDGEQVWTDMVPVKFFQEPLFGKKAYLNDYAERGISILEEIGANPKKHRIEICTGYVNKNLKNALREMGFDVRVNEIKGLLQDQLEERFRYNVHGILGVDLAYDPKQIGKAMLGKRYYEVLHWGQANAPQWLKSGWKSIQEENHA